MAGRDSHVFLTPTFAGDLACFRDLRASITPLGVPHVVVVDTEDLDAFREFEDDTLTLLTTADVLPAPVEARRTTTRAAHHRLNPIRYTKPLPLAGWWLQQIVKLSFAAHCPTERYVCIDSDAIVRRAFVVPERGVYANPLQWIEEAGWYVNACRLFEIPLTGEPAETHTCSPQVLNARIVRAMLDEIEARRRGPWWKTMLDLRLTEYETYAAYAIHRAGFERVPISIGGIDHYSKQPNATYALADVVTIQSKLPNGHEWREHLRQ